MRNLASVRQNDIVTCYNHLGKDGLIDILASNLHHSSRGVAHEALMVVLNLACCKPAHVAIMAHEDLLRSIFELLVRRTCPALAEIDADCCKQSHERSDIRTSAVQTTCNLARREPTQRRQSLCKASKSRADGFVPF